MSTLTGKQINNTYDGLLKTNDEQPLTANPKIIQDGEGNNSSFQLGTQGAKFTGYVTIENEEPILYLTDTNNNSNYGISNKNGKFEVFDNTNNITRLVIDSQGKVGIGTTSSSQKLHVDGNILATGEIISGGSITIGSSGAYNAGSIYSDANWGMIFRAFQANPNFADFMFANSEGVERFRITSNGNVCIGTTSTSYKLDVSGTGRFTSTVTATGFITSSDLRLKKNIQDYSFDKKINISLKTYEFISDGGRKRYGVIAQELEKTNPEFVITDEQGYKSVSYIDLLMAKIAELENRLKTLEN
jgi:hypothetical protein